MKTQILLDLARDLDAKDPKTHDMSLWLCGTVSCAVGDLMASGIIPKVRDGCRFSPVGGVHGVAAVLEISPGEARFLFREFSVRRRWVAGSNKWKHRSRQWETPKETAARIRKFVYYKLHKAEMDYEEARRREGDWGVCDIALSRFREMASAGATATERGQRECSD